MTLKVRRVVTAHDADGKAVVRSDETMTNIKQLRSGNFNSLQWMTDESPADLSRNEDPSLRDIDIEPPESGSIFRLLELVPGKKAYMHRTETIDYAIVLSGECDMLLDDSEVHLEAGDVLIQRATWHGWANRSNKPCQIAFILLGAHPVESHLHGVGP